MTKNQSNVLEKYKITPNENQLITDDITLILKNIHSLECRRTALDKAGSLGLGLLAVFAGVLIGTILEYLLTDTVWHIRLGMFQIACIASLWVILEIVQTHKYVLNVTTGGGQLVIAHGPMNDMKQLRDLVGDMMLSTSRTQGGK